MNNLEGTFTVEVKVSDLSGDKLNYKVDGTVKTTDMKFEYRVSVIIVATTLCIELSCSWLALSTPQGLNH
jgi:hypothetical protein